jgi:hypothetical protein
MEDKCILLPDLILNAPAWYEWKPGPPAWYNMSINAGDNVTFTAIGGNTSGAAIVENHTTGKLLGRFFNSTQKLCKKEAEWMMEFWANQSQFLMADFGNFTFSKAKAENGTLTAGPSHATLRNTNNLNYTSWTNVSIHSTSVNVAYVGN